MIKEVLGLLKKKNLFINKDKKKNILKNYFNNLTSFHYKNCYEYKKICNQLGYYIKKKYEISELPFLPVNIFKLINLRSVKKKNIITTMKSSGTTNLNLSQIHLDKKNSYNQMIALNKLFQECVGHKERLPMIVIDRKLKSADSLSARTAAILGFSRLAKDVTYALNDDLTLNEDLFNEFYKKNFSKPNIIFGFTFLVWEKFYQDKIFKKNKYDLCNSTLIHGGGWKKLFEKSISNKKFKKNLTTKFNIKNIINYYGMVEQTGSIFFECSKCENFVTSFFSDIFIRDKNLCELKNNNKGMIQLLSILPTSYPGHNILTEDIGMIVGEDDCKCGKKGKYFKIFGRLKKSEIRGCGDAINQT